MHQRRAAITVSTVVLLSLLMAGPVSAGGPTSVLLAEPATQTAASLYYTDADYEALADLVGVNSGAAQSRTPDDASTSHELGSGVTMTWLIHDVAVWRVDRVYVGGKGGPWIATQAVMNDAGSVYDSPVSWHKATDGPALVALLERIGFGDGSRASGSGADAAVPEVDAADQPVTPAQALPKKSQPASPTPTWGGWAWGLSGLALGVALAAAAMHVVPRLRRAAASQTPTEPAERDLTAHATPVDVGDELAWTPADEFLVG